MFKKLLLFYSQTFPIIVFIYVARFYGFNDTAWMYAFYAGSVVAIVESAILVYLNMLFSRFLLAINLFLIGGGFAFLTNIKCLLNLYDDYQQVMLFAALIIVGVITTCCTKAGFIGFEHASPEQTRRYSLYLLGASIVGFALAFVIRGYGFITAVPVVIALKFLNDYFEKCLKKS